MKELLLQYTGYNAWANKLIIDVMLKLDAEQLDKDMNSSYPSIRRTAYHIWGAEALWMQRLLLAENPVWLPGGFTGTFEEACTEWEQASQQLITFTDKQYSDKALEHVLLYNDLEKVPRKIPVYQALQHICNHSTSHRGQLFTMLRQLGVTQIPATDFYVYAMQQNRTATPNKN